MSQIVIKVENLSKQYRLGEMGTGTISHDLNRWWHQIRGKENPYLKIGEENDRSTKGTSEYVWALQDINFEVQQGEVLGIIGKNGAGKSTLLKLLSRVTSPTTGSIKAKGRIASLLEVGTGFHDELTGRENIFLNGAILGMSKAEIKGKLEEIIDFSGTERYIDTPVKRYSSGMRVRLAFAVAAHLEPEILIVDEVLAVGDAEFQKKAIGKMQNVSKEEGRTVLFVSHNMASVSNLCSRSLVIENGSVVFDGLVKEGISKYLLSSKETSLSNEILNTHGRKGNGHVRVGKVGFNPSLEREVVSNISGEPLEICFNLERNSSNKNGKLQLDFRIDNEVGSRVAWFSTSLKNRKLTSEAKYVNFKIPKNPLSPGKYIMTIFVSVDNAIADWIQNALVFEVHEGDFFSTGKIPPIEQTDIFIDFELYS